MKLLSVRSAKERQAADLIRIALLLSGGISSVYYIGINLIVPAFYPGYSLTSHTVSELSAIGAPSRPLWVLLCSFYSFLIIGFGVGIRLSANENRKLRVVGALMIVYGVSGFFWPPMHQREVLARGGGSLSDTMHIVFTMITVLLMMLMIGFGAKALGKWFGFYSVGTLVILVFFGMLTGLEAPNISENLPTPLIGVWERINIGIYMLWVIALSIVLIRKNARV